MRADRQGCAGNSRAENEYHGGAVIAGAVLRGLRGDPQRERVESVQQVVVISEFLQNYMKLQVLKPVATVNKKNRNL